MRWTKRIFLGYVVAVGLALAGVGVSMSLAPSRDAGTLHVSYRTIIESMDPPKINDAYAPEIVGEIYECLYNYKYGVRPYELFPELAAAMPVVSADRKTVTIPLRKGIRFYSPDPGLFAEGAGPEVKAADFVYSWKRMADFHVASPNFSSLFQGRIEGLDEWWEYTRKTDAARIDWDRPVSGLTAVDDYTLRIRLVEPFPQLAYVLAYLPSAVVCRAAVEKYGPTIGKHPVGTGAYYLKEHSEEREIVLAANPIYRGRPDVDGGTAVPAGERLPKIQRVKWEYFREVVPAWLLFKQGLFDTSEIPKESFNQAIGMHSGELTEELSGRGVRLRSSPEAMTYYFGLNMQDPVLGRNKALRQAMSMAFNREEYVRVYHNGRGQPAIGPIPPGFPTFDAGRVNRYTQFNLEAAREKMVEARRIQGGAIPPLKLLLGSTNTSIRQTAEYFVNQMGQIGVTVEPEYLTWPRFRERVDRHEAQIYYSAWVTDYPEERNCLQLYYGKNAPAGGINYTGYINPAFDVLYEQAVTMDPSARRDAMYRRLEQMVMEDCPGVFVYYPINYTLYYEWVKELHFMDYGYGHRAFQTLDSKGRAARMAGAGGNPS